MARNGPTGGSCHLRNLFLKLGVCHCAGKAAIGAELPPIAIADSGQNHLLQTLLLISGKRISAELLDEIYLVITRSKEMRIGLKKLNREFDRRRVPRY